MGAYGNFVNRTLKFIQKSFNGIIPANDITPIIQNKVIQGYDEVGRCIEAGSFKQGLEKVFGIVRFSNKYFDEQQPWIQIKEDTVSCRQSLADCVYLIANLAQILSPFLPFSSSKVKKMINSTEEGWKPIIVTPGELSTVEPLFVRIELERIEAERARLADQTI